MKKILFSIFFIWCGAAEAENITYPMTVAGTIPPLSALDVVVEANATSGAFTATLPDAITGNGSTITIIKTDTSTNAVTVSTSSSQSLIFLTGTATSELLSSYGSSITVQSDGTSWDVVSYNSLSIGGTKFTTSGCSVSATTGSATAGTYTSGTSGTCTVVITMNGATGMTAPNGWFCAASDRTTATDIITQSSSSTTTGTLTGPTVSGDVVGFSCVPY